MELSVIFWGLNHIAILAGTYVNMDLSSHKNLFACKSGNLGLSVLWFYVGKLTYVRNNIDYNE